MTEYKSKHGVVKTPPYQLYMSFVDMRNFLQMLPEDKRGSVDADYDTISASVQGFEIGVKVYERVPYSKISVIDNGAPFGFKIDLCFDSNNGDMYSTDFHIDVEADLNFMMKMMIGSKIQEGLDKIVQSMVDLSNGVMPEGFDPSMYPDYFGRK